MKSSVLRPRLLAAGATVALAASLATHQAHAGPGAPDVPDTIAVDGEHQPFLVTHAVGVQIYACRAGVNGPRWGLVAPRADLYGQNDQLVGTHFGGPRWQAKDGSTVVGQRVDGVTVDQTAIPWLLLSASGTGGPDGDRLADTSFIQRVNTVGGLEPTAAECTTATVGTTDEVPYTADYYFWKPITE